MMNASSKIAGMAFALAATIAAAQPASATSFVFDTTGSNTLVSSKIFTSTVNGTTLSVRVTGWHATDVAGNTDKDTISAASLGLYSAGVGVLSSGESTSGNYHQIDNVGGVDFVMLQFSQAVNLTAINRTVFALSGVSSTDSDAAYWADTTGAVGTAANWNSAINLASGSVSESLWSSIPGTAASGSTSVSSNSMAAVWLVGADFLGTRNDGFKLTSLTVSNVAPAVPEPASWAMMTIGFGALGGALRRRRGASRSPQVTFA